MNAAYKNLLIYYFSGTGNAKRAAEWIIETAIEMGINARTINIDRFVKPEIPEVEGKTMIGFCSPTHGFNLHQICSNLFGNSRTAKIPMYLS